MKKLLSFYLFLIMAMGAVAEDRLDVQRIEGEIRTGMSLPLGGYHGGCAKGNALLGAELRYNFKQSPWDCGILIVELDVARRGYGYSDSRLRTATFGILGDYNFRQGRKINPFAGLVVGGGVLEPIGSFTLNPNHHGSMVFMPRVGCEFFRHIRLTASTTLSRKGYNTFNIALGIVIGGRPKK